MRHSVVQRTHHAGNVLRASAPRVPQQQQQRLKAGGLRPAVACAASDGGQAPDEGEGQQQQQQHPHEPAAASNVSEAMHRSLSEVAKSQGRQSNGLNLFLVGESEETWRRLDKRVNQYPIQREFTAIGSGGSEFKASMIKAVEEVVGPVHVECISERPSSRGSYLSVTVGPVWVESCEQIIQIYSNMKERGKSNIKWII